MNYYTGTLRQAKAHEYYVFWSLMSPVVLSILPSFQEHGYHGYHGYHGSHECALLDALLACALLNVKGDHFSLLWQ